MTDCPGQDGVAGDHQVVNGERNQGAVVGGHAGRPQDLEHDSYQFVSNVLILCKTEMYCMNESRKAML